MTANWSLTLFLLQLQMLPGKRYPVKIEWKPNGEYIGLRCLTSQEPQEREMLSLWSEVADQIDYCFIAGGDIDQVISGYRRLTGKSPMMPRWAMGHGRAGSDTRPNNSCWMWSGNSASVGSLWTTSSRTDFTGLRINGAITAPSPPATPILPQWFVNCTIFCTLT